ncbi:MAG: class A beta-lactamase-related serine hydrolase [Candidatus Eremiobacteraeota bacterium]|nr:class A beta-lactamase-related serine hydrolase [Candidatus Eremiobacteraeota bacterium]
MRWRCVLTFSIVLWLLPATGSAAVVPGPLADLQKQLSTMSLRAPGQVAMEVQDLSTGITSSVNPSASMPAASTIKIPVMVEVFRQLAVGNFDLNTSLRLTYADKDWGSGSISVQPVGSVYSVSRLLTAMITVSDNTATNMLIRLVGRSNINTEMTSLGLEHTKLSDYIRSSGNSIRRALRTSPADMVALLNAMAHERLIDAWSSRQMIVILSGQRHNGLLPAPLPPGLAIAHKTGTLHDTLNDVGIVYADSEPYVIAVMTTNLPTLSSGRSFIRSVSKVTYDALQRFGTWRITNDSFAPDQPTATPAPSGTPLWDQTLPQPEPSPPDDSQ